MMIVGRGVAGFGAGGEYPGRFLQLVVDGYLRKSLNSCSLRD